MKNIIFALFLVALLPAVAYSQPLPGGTVAVKDGAVNSRRLTVTAGGAALVDGTATVQPVSQSGTWTVQPGNTANTTAWLTQDTPAASGGYTTFHLVSAGTTNATNIKASAGQLYCWYIYNSNTSARKVALHNTAGTPTAGASVAISMVIPASSGANNCAPAGIPFNVGIGITTVTGLADSDATAVAANDLIINLWYK